MRQLAARCCGAVGMTDTVAFADLPSTLALTVPMPSATPLTSPVALTVTTVLASDVHMMARPGTTAPFTARGVAVITCAAPGATASEDRKSTRLNSSHSQISYAV